MSVGGKKNSTLIFREWRKFIRLFKYESIKLSRCFFMFEFSRLF